MSGTIATSTGRSVNRINTPITESSNLELLRIIAMLLLIAHNYVASSGLINVIYQIPTAKRSLFFFVFGAWGKTAFNCFGFLTGYLMCKSQISVRDFFIHVLELLFYNVVFYCIFSVCGYSTFSVNGLWNSFSFLLHANTNYLSCYLFFYLCIPFLNILICNLSKKQHSLLICLTVYIYVVLGTLKNASVTMNYISWFCVLYFIAAYIRLYPQKVFENTKILFCGFAIVLLISIASIFHGARESSLENKQTVYYYLSDVNKILAVLTALFAFLFFKSLKVPYNKYINQISASTFGVYCIHANSAAMRKWLWTDVLKTHTMYSYPWFLHISHALLSVLGVYAVCVIVDRLRVILIEKPFFKIWDHYMASFLHKAQQYLHEFWKYRDLLKLLVSKNIKLKYRRSWLGYVWSILNPLLIMVVMSIVFSTMFKRNIENFPVYLFCGQLLFNFMNTATTQSIFSITGNASLLKKTYVPKYLFTLAKVTSCLVDLLFSLGALVIVIIVTKSRITWHVLLFPFVLLQLYVFCIGIGLFLAQASVFFKDAQFIYNAVTTAWTYLTPIFYPVEALPEQLAWGIQHLNPMYFYIGQFRALVYSGTLPEPYLIISGIVTAFAVLLLGMWSFLRSKDRFILYI